MGRAALAAEGEGQDGGRVGDAGTRPMLTVDESLHCLGAAVALHRVGGRRGLDLFRLGCGELGLGSRPI
jgi:hypothetical protein